MSYSGVLKSLTLDSERAKCFPVFCKYIYIYTPTKIKINALTLEY